MCLYMLPVDLLNLHFQTYTVSDGVIMDRHNTMICTIHNLNVYVNEDLSKGSTYFGVCCVRQDGSSAPDQWGDPTALVSSSPCVRTQCWEPHSQQWEHWGTDPQGNIKFVWIDGCALWSYRRAKQSVVVPFCGYAISLYYKLMEALPGDRGKHKYSWVPSPIPLKAKWAWTGQIVFVYMSCIYLQASTF